ncbi:hypothetical protein PLICRDRAFT_179041 [Plicaturopsis crispa FD-325 SS-3]|uniref:Macrofage activating glycoprotein n=1 Tax=Plicaturopsis crispa FD-325 SS-3 TaxID=944288 RepID=A0A0C9SYX6_PLICR|nr:hypothetical protein PLICRDRAFT_179041 [Plicaturopsis crispa FD-325 SS-3]
MSPHALSMLLAFAAATPFVVAQIDPAVTKPLADKRFNYPDQVPYMVDTDQGTRRGPQLGYNKCNSTTEGENSMCQTGFLNSLDDFCLWAPSKPNSLIADTEGEEVAWCTKPGRGTRVIPPGALQGVQFMRTPDYIQVVGFIDNTKINLQADDSGGELDPHGADLRGNPMGGLLYSNGFPSNNGNNQTFQQVIEWHNFMGGNAFCFKACDPAGKNAADFCQHIYDRIGCAYNAPNAAQKGVYESCQGDNQDFPGIYTENGQVMTYTQPPESLGAIATMPYQPRVPASSNCVTFSSEQLYATAAATSSGAQAKATGASASSSSKAGSAKNADATSASSSSSSGAAGAPGVGGGFSALVALGGVIAGMLLIN